QSWPAGRPDQKKDYRARVPSKTCERVRPVDVATSPRYRAPTGNNVERPRAASAGINGKAWGTSARSRRRRFVARRKSDHARTNDFVDTQRAFPGPPFHRNQLRRDLALYRGRPTDRSIDPSIDRPPGRHVISPAWKPRALGPFFCIGTKPLGRASNAGRVQEYPRGVETDLSKLRQTNESRWPLGFKRFTGAASLGKSEERNAVELRYKGVKREKGRSGEKGSGKW
ncbi:hypothetical protein K0M31_015373, partial [Melipona bicolor]